MNNSLVSILVTTYNHEAYVEQAILSCLNQTYDNIEIVISDDASIDKTPKILENLKNTYPDKLKLNLNRKNFGLNKNANICLSMCEGDYIAFFSGDDVMHTNKIELQINEFLKNPNLVLCGHGMNYIDSKSNFIFKGHIGLRRGVGLRDWLYGDVVTNALSIMVVANRIPVGGYDQRLYSGEKKLWIDILRNDGEFLYLDEYLVDYRRHKSNLSKDYRTIEDSRIFLSIIKEEFKFIPLGYINEVKSSIYFSEFAYFWNRKKYMRSITKVMNCLFCSPKVFIQRLSLILGGKGSN
jgi:glycosyltransferase involved in cell wall biosynthesis